MYRPMEWNSQSRYRHIHLWIIDFQQGFQDHLIGKDSTTYSAEAARKPHKEKNEVRTLLYTTYKNWLKVDQWPKYEG